MHASPCEAVVIYNMSAHNMKMDMPEADLNYEYINMNRAI